MAAPTLWVSPSVFRKASELLGPSLRDLSNGSVIREAVELVLKSDLGADTGGQKPVSGEKVVDAGALLQKGLQILANNPYAALDIQLGVQTMDVHKAFRKMALKYHPDKSPKTTALFQAIQAASEKLSDAGSRRQEEQRAAAFNMANTTAGRNAVPTKPSAPPPSSFKPPHMPSFNFNTRTPMPGSAQNPRAPPMGPQSTQHRRQESTSAGPSPRPTPTEPPSTDRNTYSHSSGEAPGSAAQRRAEALRLEAEAKARYAAFRREEDARIAREKEEAARRHREDILQQGARKSAAEQQRQREEAMARELHAQRQREAEALKQRERAADDARVAEALRRQGLYKEKPTATPDEGASSSSASGASNFRGMRAGGGGGGAGSQPFVGQTFTVNSSGNVRSSGFAAGAGSGTGAGTGAGAGANPSASSASAKLHANRAGMESRIPVPRPFALCATAVGATMVELEWRLSILPAAPIGNAHVPSALKNRNLVSEFAWRCVTRGAESGWQSSSRLVSGNRVRKKNLEKGGRFEFRVRAVEELPGGLLGDRSEWSESLGVSLVVVPQAQAQAQAQQAQAQAQQAQTQSQPKPQPYDKLSGLGPSEEWDFVDIVNVSDDEDDDDDDEAADKVKPTPISKPFGSTRTLDRKDSKLAWGDEDAGGAGPGQDGQDGQGPGKGVQGLGGNLSFNKTHYAKFYSEPAGAGGGAGGAGAGAGAGAGVEKRDRGNIQEQGHSHSHSQNQDPEQEQEQEQQQQQDHEDPEDEHWYDLIPNSSSGRARHGPITAPSYEHPVRALPSSDAPVVGHLVPGLSVQARRAPPQLLSSKGSGYNWLYVRFHTRAKTVGTSSSSSSSASEPSGGGGSSEWGYALRSDRGHVFLVRAETYSDDDDDEAEAEGLDTFGDRAADQNPFHVSSNSSSSSSNAASSSASASASDGDAAFPDTWSDGVDLWQELYDEGHARSYFFNPRTGESQWTAPEWLEETDPNSGANYYVRVDPSSASPLHSTWSRPTQFARLTRLKE